MTSPAEPTVGPDTRIAPTALVGVPFRPLLDGRQLEVDRATSIGASAWIGEHATVGQGATIGAGSILEDYARVQPMATIGARVLVTNGAYVGIGATISDDCVIKSHIGDNVQVAAGCRIAGDLVHRQLDPSVPWDDPAGDEPSPSIGERAFVGWRALIVGGVNIGAGAYVCAGALVTKDVPAGHIAYGRNQFTRPDDWPGALGKSPFFEHSPTPARSAARVSRWFAAGGLVAALPVALLRAMANRTAR